MAILLLCRGNEQAKAMLRHALTTHYGPNPVGYESVRMLATGRVKQTISRFNIWLSLQLDTHFLFPHQFRQDYKITFWQIPLLNKSEAFDGVKHYQKNRNQPAIITSAPDPYLELVQLRLDTFSSLLLLPLNEIEIVLSYVDDHQILVTNTRTQTQTKLLFYDNFQVKQIITIIQGNPAEFRMDLSREVIDNNSVKIFKEIKIFWNGVFRYELYPTDIQFIDEMTDKPFVLD